MDTALLQGIKIKLPTRKVCKTKDFSCTILEYTWEHTDQEYWRKKGENIKSKKKALEKWEVQRFVKKEKKGNI